MSAYGSPNPCPIRWEYSPGLFCHGGCTHRKCPASVAGCSGEGCYHRSSDVGQYDLNSEHYRQVVHDRITKILDEATKKAQRDAEERKSAEASRKAANDRLEKARKEAEALKRTDELARTSKKPCAECIEFSTILGTDPVVWVESVDAMADPARWRKMSKDWYETLWRMGYTVPGMETKGTPPPIEEYECRNSKLRDRFKAMGHPTGTGVDMTVVLDPNGSAIPISGRMRAVLDNDYNTGNSIYHDGWFTPQEYAVILLLLGYYSEHRHRADDVDTFLYDGALQVADPALAPWVLWHWHQSKDVHRSAFRTVMESKNVPWHDSTAYASLGGITALLQVALRLDAPEDPLVRDKVAIKTNDEWLNRLTDLLLAHKWSPNDLGVVLGHLNDMKRAKYTVEDSPQTAVVRRLVNEMLMEHLALSLASRTSTSVGKGSTDLETSVLSGPLISYL